jgi:homogentisate 1,2-dioxygenase
MINIIGTDKYGIVTFRTKNQRSWLYRIRPSVQHTNFEPYKVMSNGGKNTTDMSLFEVNPNQLRWSPRPLLSAKGYEYHISPTCA